MTYIEDVVCALDGLAAAQRLAKPLDPWLLSFIRQLAETARAERPYTTRQAEVLLRNLRRLAPGLPIADLTTLLAEPRYRRPLRQSMRIVNEVRAIGNGCLAFRSKYHPVLIKALGRIAAQQGGNTLWFNRQHRVWVICVTAETRVALHDLILQQNFAMDDATQTFIDQIRGTLRRSASVTPVADEVVTLHTENHDALAAWAARVPGALPL